MARQGRKRKYSETAKSSQRKSESHLTVPPPIDPCDRCLTCGSGEQLGHPGRDTTKKPRWVDKIDASLKLVQACAGGVFSLLLTEDGRVFGCGVNEKGSLPVNDLEAGDITDEFTELVFEPEIQQHGKVVQIAAGASFAAALTHRGSVIAWGNLRDPQGDFAAHPQFQQMQNQPVVVINHDKLKIIKLAAGENHLVMLSNTGQVLTLGDGSQGQLGRSRRFATIRTSYLADETGQRLVVKLLQRGKLLRFVDIFAGGCWTILKAEGGRLFACGLNNFAQLGIPLPKQDFVQQENGSTQTEKKDEGNYNILTPIHIKAFDSDSDWTHVSGVTHLVLRNENGEAYAIGRNIDNALGIGSWTGRQDEEHWRYDTPQRIQFPDDVKIAGVTASQGSSIAWTEDGKAYAFGFDTSGQLGLGLTEGDDKMVPTPRLIRSLHLDDFKIATVQLADQHAVFLARHA